MTRWMLLGAALAALAGCRTEVICPADQTACGRRCLALQSDPDDCGACGHACGPTQICSAGSCAECSTACTGTRGCQGRICLPDVEVSCFSTDELRPLTITLAPSGPPVPVDDGPISLASLSGRSWVAHSLSTPTVLGVDPLGAPSARALLGGGDLEMIRAWAGPYGSAGGLLYVSDADTSSLVVVDPGLAVSDPTHAVVDEVDLKRDPTKGENPKGIAFVGDQAFVALYGDASRGDYSYGQAIAVVDLPAGACAASHCGQPRSWISLQGIGNPPLFNDASALPFPSGAVAVGATVYVLLANLQVGSSGYYTDPAGDGLLLALDTTHGDAFSLVDLPGCRNPGTIAAAGTQLFVACSSSGVVLPVDLSSGTPVPGTAIPVTDGSGAPIHPGGIALCNGVGYVTDQLSGTVVRFDPTGATPQVRSTVCPVYPPPPVTTGFAWASDVACAP